MERPLHKTSDRIFQVSRAHINPFKLRKTFRKMSFDALTGRGRKALSIESYDRHTEVSEMMKGFYQRSWKYSREALKSLTLTTATTPYSRHV